MPAILPRQLTNPRLPTRVRSRAAPRPRSPRTLAHASPWNTSRPTSPSATWIRARWCASSPPRSSAPTPSPFYYQNPAGQPARSASGCCFEATSPTSALPSQAGPGPSPTGSAFKLAAEAYRIDLANLFDPMMAIHSANVEPLPHQICAA